MDSVLRIGHLFAGDSAEHDRNLSEYFVQTPEYKSIRDGSVILVTGRKGTGKSSIYRYIVERDIPSAEGLTFDEYPWQVHNRLVDNVHSEESRHVHTWKFLILVTLAKQIISERGFWRRLARGVRVLRRFLRQNYGSLAPSTGEILVDKLGRLKKVELGELGTFELEDSKDDIRRLSAHVNIANNRLSEVLARVVGKHKKYFILFDKLDDGWDGTEDYRSSLVGLIKAAADLNMRIPQLRAIVFLRTDIFNVLQFNDKNKFNAKELRVDLQWTEEDLIGLIEERIHRLGRTPQRAGTWDLIFTPAKMKNQTTKANYLLKRTFLRPRDVISFCAECRGEALNRGVLQIDNADVYEGEKEYSKRIHQELLDEYLKHHPFLESLLEVIKAIGRENFAVDEFEAERLKRDRLPALSVCLQLLFDMSVIGIRQKGGRGGGERFMFVYLDPELKIPDGHKEFIVHRSLRQKFALQSGYRRVGADAEEPDSDELDTTA